MNQTAEEQNEFREGTEQIDAKTCGCEKTTCAIGIASVAIGVVGFILASLL